MKPHPKSPIPLWRAIFAILISALFLLLSVSPLFAQTPIILTQLELEFWPEFDRSEVLILVSGSLPADTPLPATITLQLPGASGEPHAVAMADPTGNLLTAPYSTRTTQKGEVIVTLTTEYANFRVEYYALYGQTGTQRDFAFSWPADYAAQAVTIRVQEPKGASQLVLEPPMSAVGVGPYGLNYFAQTINNVAAGQPIAFNLRYAKTDNALSNPSSPAATAQPPATATTPDNFWLITLSSLAGAALIGGGGYYWWMRRASQAPSAYQGKSRRGAHGRGNKVRHTAPKRSEPAGGKISATPNRAPLDAQFCTQCGQATQVEDAFCRKCGHSLTM